MELFTTDKLLGSENWVRWKWMVEGLLMEKENAHEVCSGEIVKPEPVPEDAALDVRTKYNSDVAIWLQTGFRTKYNYIYLHL